MAKQMDPSRLRKIGQEGFDLLDSLKGQSGLTRRVPQPQFPLPPPTQPRVYHQQHYYQQPHTYYVAEPQTWTTVAASNETIHHFHHYMTSHVGQVQEQHITPNNSITSDQAAGYYDGFCVVDHGTRSRLSRWA